MQTISDKLSSTGYVIFNPKTYLDQVKIIVILRWLAIICVIFMIIAGKYILGLGFDPLPILIVDFTLIVLNYYYTYKLTQMSKKETFSKSELGLSHAFIIDQVLLCVILFFVGGITNPFSFIFVFDTLISGILLSRNHCFLHSGVSIILVTLLASLQALGFVCQKCHIFSVVSNQENLTLILISWSALVFSIVVVAGMITYLMDIYREKVMSLRTLNKILTNSQDEKAKFYRVAAHEMKSPVAGVTSLLNTITHLYEDSLPDDAKKLLNKASKRSGTIIATINDLLTMSDEMTGTKKLEIKKNSLIDVIKEVLENEYEKLDEKKMKVVEDFDYKYSETNFDKDEIFKVFTNLISNAIRYSPEKTNITIKNYSDNKYYCVSVKDEGIGIPKEDIAKIGKDFFRTTKAKEFSKEGTGLGMAITFNIVRQHGGDVEIKSELGKGSEFIVKLPI